jgi:hypothetical protein
MTTRSHAPTAATTATAPARARILSPTDPPIRPAAAGLEVVVVEVEAALVVGAAEVEAGATVLVAGAAVEVAGATLEDAAPSATDSGSTSKTEPGEQLYLGPPFANPS